MNIIKEQKITKEYILEKVGALNIFIRYMPHPFKLNRRCKNPHTKDNNPSCIIGNQTGEIIYKCFNSSHQGDCFSFVMNLFNISFKDTIELIANDFGLKKSSIKKYEQVILDLPKIEITKPHSYLIQCKPFKNWQNYHIDYLKQYTLEPKDLQFCSNTKAFPLEEYWINKRKMIVKQDELGFFYNVGTYNKIYFPLRPKEDKWKSSIPFNVIHGLDNMKGCDIGILTKSLKDGAILSKHITKCTCVIQAENVTSISKENAQFLKENVKQLYIAMDCDAPGKQASYAICDYLNAKHINPPDRILEKKGSDFSDMVKLEGLDSFLNHFKQKKLI